MVSNKRDNSFHLHKCGALVDVQRAKHVFVYDCFMKIYPQKMYAF